MIDETLFENKLDELNQEHIELINQRHELIGSHTTEIDLAIQTASQKFIEENRERITREVLGEKLVNIDTKLEQVCAIKDVLNSMIIQQPEAEATPSDDAVQSTEEQEEINE